MALVEEGHHNYCINDYCINYSIIVFHNKLREFKYFDLDYIRAVMLIREVGGGGGMHFFNQGMPLVGGGT